MKKYILPLVLLVGCATSEKYHTSLQTWLGKPSDNLVAQWGVPSAKIKLDSGKQAFEYTNGSSQQVLTNQWGRVVAEEVVYSCTTTFMIGEAGLIESFSFRGNTCRSR